MGLFSSQISTNHLVPLCRQLATTYDAGIPIVQAFDVVGRQAGSRRVREVMSNMRSAVEHGATLEEAARSQQKYLPPFFIQLLSTGERGGRLDIMLRDLADYFEDRQAMRRQFIASMIYPALQLAAAWFLGSFALLMVFNLSLEGISIEHIVTSYVELQTIAVIVLAIALAVAVVLSRLGMLVFVTGWIGTYIWPFSRVTRKLALARFFRSLSLLIGSGLNMLRCIEGAAAVTVNPYIERDLLQAMEPIRNGSTLTQAFASSRYMPGLAREMMMVGEQSGELELQLRKVSDWLVQEGVHALTIMQRVFNVLIVLLVGTVIGFVIITFYMKYFSFLDSI
jgi:type IV pilus assembly protein PilC